MLTQYSFAPFFQGVAMHAVAKAIFERIVRKGDTALINPDYMTSAMLTLSNI
jgi:hypothetical protein